MKELTNIRKGNLIECWGPYGLIFAYIHSIDDLDNGRKKFHVLPHDKQYNVFDCYSEQSTPISLTHDRLLQLGSSFNAEQRIHSIGTVVLAAFGYTEGNNPFSMTGGYTNYYVLPVGFSLPTTREKLKQDAIEVPHIHTLQNYYSETGRELDVSAIRW